MPEPPEEWLELLRELIDEPNILVAEVGPELTRSEAWCFATALTVRSREVQDYQPMVLRWGVIEPDGAAPLNYQAAVGNLVSLFKMVVFDKEVFSRNFAQAFPSLPFPEIIELKGLLKDISADERFSALLDEDLYHYEKVEEVVAWLDPSYDKRTAYDLPTLVFEIKQLVELLGEHYGVIYTGESIQSLVFRISLQNSMRNLMRK